MRWLLSLSVALAASTCCNLAWTRSTGVPFLWWRQDAETSGRVSLIDMRGAPSPFVETSEGVRVVEHDRGWSYGQARFLPDMDGDGHAEVALAAQRPSRCGNDVEGSLEIYSGRFLMPIGKWEGFAAFSIELAPRSGVLERRKYGFKGPEIRVGYDLRERERWMGSLPWVADARYVGDLDDDGYEDVAVDGWWTEESREEQVKSVRVLAGSDGHVLWTKSDDGRPGFGWDVTSAGDWNGDGRPDVALLSERSVTILSGGDGRQLSDAEVPATSELTGLSGAGDLDGDGRIDFRCRVGPPAIHHWLFCSSDTWQPLDVAGGWNVVWSANRGDLDGDHRDDLVVGRVHPKTYERRISVYSSGEVTDVRLVDMFELPWDDLGAPDVGRFRDGDPWSVLLPLTVKDGRFKGRSFTAVYPGT